MPPVASSVDFETTQPTRVVFGSDAATHIASFASVFGTRVLIVCGQTSARRNGALADVERSLSEKSLTIEYLEGVPSNPATGIVEAGAAFAADREIDVIVAVGGGSVIDTAKAVSVAAHLDAPVRSLLSGIDREKVVEVNRTMPVIAVPTLPGSASEVNGTCVLTDTDTGRKLSFHTVLAQPRVALVDATYAARAPTELLSAGAADAMCHALEAALSKRANIASDTWSRAAVDLLVEAGEEAVVAHDRTAMAKVMWASALSGQALASAGSLVTHPIAHSVGARFGASHGVATGVFEPVVLAVLAGRWCDNADTAGKATEIAGWFSGSTPADDKAAMRLLVGRLMAWYRRIGFEYSLADLGVSREHISQLIDDTLLSGSRGLTNVPGGSISAFDVEEIIEAALTCTSVTVPRALIR